MRNNLMIVATAIAVLALISGGESNIEPQLVAPACIVKEDCIAGTKEGYCGIEFDCIAGQCFTEDLLCPETCNSGIDDDQDSFIDCDDTDCWDSPLCHCTVMNFNECAVGRCYCEPGSGPRWHAGEINYCGCI
jgi:hypothetical protein